MASLKAFITISLLRKLHTGDLAELVNPMRELLNAEEIWTITEDGRDKFDYPKLARYLHEYCTQEVEDRLYSLHAIAKPELYDEITSRLRRLGIEFNVFDDIFQVAAKLVNANIASCNIIASKKMAAEAHTYEHFKPVSPQNIAPLSDIQIETLKRNLGSYFEKCGKSAHIDIYAHIIGDFAYYCVSHGSPRTRENSVGEEQRVYTFRPELVDIVRLKLSNGDISIYAKNSASKSLKECYCKTFGNLVMPESIIVPDNKYNMNALRNPGSLHSLEQDIFVSVEAFSYIDENGCKKECSKNVSGELCRCMGEVSRVNFKSITFSFQFVIGGPKYKVRLAGDNRSEIASGCDENAVENFFREKGFIVRDEDEGIFRMVS